MQLLARELQRIRADMESLREVAESLGFVGEPFFLIAQLTAWIDRVTSTRIV